VDRRHRLQGENHWVAQPKGPEVFERHYLRGSNPREQSGFGGDERRWEVARRPVVTAIDRDGTFLDVGCANGYLLESVVRWWTQRIEPYGLDFAPRLVALARRRLSQWRDRIFLGEAMTWDPPHRFDFVRTELGYARPGCERELVERLLQHVLTPGGKLIVCSYGSPRSGQATEPVGKSPRSWGYELGLELEQQAPEGGGTILHLAVLGAPPPEAAARLQE